MTKIISRKKIFPLLIAVLPLIFASLCFAKTINLYDQPKADAKVIGTVDSDKGIIPIFTPKEGQWIKVGNPSNGNVGWVKMSDLNAPPGAMTEFTFMQHMLNGDKNQQLTPEQIKQMQLQQQQIQESMKKMMQDMFKDMGNVINPIFDKENTKFSHHYANYYCSTTKNACAFGE